MRFRIHNLIFFLCIVSVQSSPHHSEFFLLLYCRVQRPVLGSSYRQFYMLPYVLLYRWFPFFKWHNFEFFVPVCNLLLYMFRDLVEGLVWWKIHTSEECKKSADKIYIYHLSLCNVTQTEISGRTIKNFYFSTDTYI